MFTRRFAVFPSLAVLMAVSGVVIVDTPPPVAANAATFGKVAVVGEFEDGPFNVATDLLSSSDQPTIFGGFGYTYGTSKYRYACAKRSGGTEPWNGNGWVQTAKLPFGGLCFVRVDTSVGSISITPRAFLQGSAKGPFNLTPAQTFIFNANGAGNVTVTFAGTAGSITGTGGTFNAFTGGESIIVAVNGGAPTTVVFQPADTTIAAIISRINTVLGATIASNASGQIKLTSPTFGTGSTIAVTAGAATTTLGLGGAATAGTGDAVDLAQTTFAEAKAKIETASALVLFNAGPSGFPRLISKLAGTGTIAIGAGTGNAALGFATTTTTTAATPSAVTIPAGTRASDGGSEALRVVTMQTTTVAAGSTGTTLLKVRPAVDDGTFAGVAVANDVDTLEDQPSDLEWAVGNPAALTAALNASQLDSAYLTAIAATKGVGNAITRRINGLISARRSDAICAAILANAVDAPANGHEGRRGFICAPNGSSAATIIGSTPAGVQSYRAPRVSYCAGGVEWVSQEMIDGGYSTDGVVVRHPDAMLAARWSVLPPGFNPGQLPEDPLYRYSPSIFRGLESVAKSWDLATYAAFKVAGVSAAFFDNEMGITFEQGITSVSPASEPENVTIARMTLADYVGDTCSGFARSKAKRQGTDARRQALKDAIEGFLDTLMEAAARDAATVREYAVSFRTEGLPTGVVEYLIAVTPIGSDDVIIFNLKVGPKAVELSRAA